MGETITFKEMLELLDSGKYIDKLEWVECNIQKGTGGVLRTAIRVCKYVNPSHSQQKALSNAQPKENKNSKNPNHYENSTRNIKFPNGELEKVHIRLIRKINGKTVL
jgi:hypothetical protein